MESFTKQTLVQYANPEKTTKMITYNPKETTSTKIIQITDKDKDPFDLPRFKTKKVPRDLAAEPVPILKDAAKKLTAEEQRAWKIPPCISHWKNSKGYTIPIDIRVAVDGRNLKNQVVSDKFAKFSDVMNMTEKQARKDIEEKNRLMKTIEMNNAMKKEAELREAAKEIRQKKINMSVSNISSVKTEKSNESDIFLNKKRNVTEEEFEKEKMERNLIRDQRKKEIEREKRLENNKALYRRNEERDVSEQIALGMAQPTLLGDMVDPNLYNSSAPSKMVVV